MENKRFIQRMVWGYVLLVGLAILQELLIYLNVFRDQSFTLLYLSWDSPLDALRLCCWAFGPAEVISAVGIFVYIVAYFVWLTTHAEVDVLSNSWLWLLPANVAVATFIKSGLMFLIRESRMCESLRRPCLRSSNTRLTPWIKSLYLISSSWLNLRISSK